MDKKVFIVKADGTREEFDPLKLEDSLRRAKTSEETVRKIVSHIYREIQDGISTEKIYAHAFELLHKFERPVAARYSLRKAISELGPSGFPFEKFIAEVLKARGFEAITNQIVQGKCVDHEMDVVAWNNSKLFMAEAKFHNEFGLKSDFKVALYIKARFDDLLGEMFHFGGKERKLDQGWLITNTKFTEKAIRYAECAGVRLIGWNYPKENNLHDMIADVNLHPVTCLTSLSGAEKRLLLERGITLCKTLREDSQALKALGLSAEKIAQVVTETDYLCPVA
jgi:hypothetical protein